MSRPPHIVQLSHKITGHRYAIGDVHGSAKGFCAILERLTPNDELFCVGDLFDRGKGNLDIFKALQQTKKKVYVTRGNHEEMLLCAIDAIRNFKNGCLTQKNANDLLMHLNCGGKWLFTEKSEEVSHVFESFRQTIKTVQRALKQNTNKDQLEKFIIIETRKMNAALNILTTFKDSLINVDMLLEMESYIESLPYIIFVGNFAEKHNAFTIVHADMPIDDIELEERLTGKNRKKPLLTEAEINHAIWARVDSHQNTLPGLTGRRSRDSILTIAGHDIIGGLKEIYDKETTFTEVSIVRPLRYESRTINLDRGACAHGEIFLLANLTEGTVSLTGSHTPEIDATDDPAITETMRKISEYLKSHLVTANRINQLTSIDKTLTDYLASFEKQTALPNSTLFSPRSRSEIANAREMLAEVRRLLKDDLTEGPEWIPPTTPSATLKEISEQLCVLREAYQDTWVLVEEMHY